MSDDKEHSSLAEYLRLLSVGPLPEPHKFPLVLPLPTEEYLRYSALDRQMDVLKGDQEFTSPVYRAWPERWWPQQRGFGELPATPKIEGRTAEIRLRGRAFQIDEQLAHEVDALGGSLGAQLNERVLQATRQAFQGLFDNSPAQTYANAAQPARLTADDLVASINEIRRTAHEFEEQQVERYGFLPYGVIVSDFDHKLVWSLKELYKQKFERPEFLLGGFDSPNHLAGLLLLWSPIHRPNAPKLVDKATYKSYRRKLKKLYQRSS